MKTTIAFGVIALISAILSCNRSERAAVSAANDYCSCMQSSIVQFKHKHDSCLKVLTPRYPLLKVYFVDMKYQKTIESLSEEDSKKTVAFGIKFIDEVNKNCCNVTWGCKPDTSLSEKSK